MGGNRTLNRLTRLVAPVNSPESHRLFHLTTTITTSAPARTEISLLRRTLPLLLHRKFSTPPIPKITSFATNDDSKCPERDPNPNSFVALSESIISSSGGDEVRDQDDAVPDETRKVLPEELSRNVVVLTCESSAEGGTCDVYLVGTAHVSKESCKEVEAIIDFLKPQVVFLELCSSRKAVLTQNLNLKVPTMGEMVEMWRRNRNVFGILYSRFLSKVASKLEVIPGSEFRVAYEEARKYGGKVMLGDRPVNITLRRTWGKMPLWHKTKLLFSLFFQACFLPSPQVLNRTLKEMDNVDMLTLLLQKMSNKFPTLMETLVHERDQYMSSTLLRVARDHSSVVAVVGKGHLQGIKNNWKQPISTKELMQIPEQKPLFTATARKILSSLGVAVAGVGIFISPKCRK